MATSEEVKKSPTAARGWKKVSQVEDLELPSGNVARVRRPGMPELLSYNIFPDELTAIAQKSVETGKTGKVAKQNANKADAEMQKVMSDPKKVAALMDSFDRILSICCVEPQVIYYKNPVIEGSDRSEKPMNDKEREEAALAEGFDNKEDVLFSDEVDQHDKVFLFNFAVGGSRDLERFRRELGESVDSLELGENVEVPS